MEGVVDDFIGRRFGKDLQLEVTGITTEQRKGSPAKYKIICHKCAEDSELFGDAEYFRAKSDILLGKLPCGCSPRPRYTEKQAVIKVSRECKRRGYLFLGFSGKYIGIKTTKLILKCLKDGNVWDSTVVQSFLKQGSGCPKCRDNGNADIQRLPDEKVIRKFMETGVYKEGTLFSRSKKKCNNRNSYWDMSCPICSVDKYVQAGLCTGMFTSSAADLSSGKLPCRCAKNHSLTSEQLKFTISNTLKNEGGNIEFKRWLKVCSLMGSSVVTFSCKEHGDWDTSYASFYNGSRCPKCAKYGYNKAKDGSLYVVQVVGQQGDFTGYGISCDPAHRMRTHKRKLARLNFSISESVIFNTTGEIAHAVEVMIKSAYELLPQNVEGFKKEATHPELFNSVVSFAKEKIAILEAKLLNSSHI